MYDRCQMMRTAKRLHKKERFDIIHCRSYIAAEAGLQLKRKFGTKFLFDMRGFWANEKVDNGQWNQQRYFFRKLFEYYKKKEKAFLTAADGIVCLTQNGKDYLLSVPGYENLQIDVIPCCADLAHFDYHRVTDAQSAQLKKELGIAK
jgi:glycosyltransferase involved in cell wall biosynthesis